MRILLALVFTLNLAFGSALIPQWHKKIHPKLNYKENYDPVAARELQTDETLADVAKGLKYYVYTRENEEVPEAVRPNVESVIRNIYSSLKPTTFSIHGAWSDKNSGENQVIVSSKLSQEDCNVIVVDYSGLRSANTDYPQLVAVAPAIGEAIADFIVLLHEHFDAKYEQFHLVGFSLGAQIAGFAGKFVQQKTKNLAHLQRITALDPAGRIFSDFTNEDQRLSRNDARFVDVIHTNAGGLGFLAPCGHADYYPNGGRVQPNCAAQDDGCSHVRAYELVREMWSRENDYLSAICKTFENISRDNCTWVNVRMGLNSIEHGIFYLETNGKYPFALGSVAHGFL